MTDTANSSFYPQPSTHAPCPEKDPFARVREYATALRALSLAMVEEARSGHPGLPLGFADVMAMLWTKHMRFDPRWPQWPNRDRFVLSAGHGSALLYATHALLGTEGLPIDALRQFRQLHGITPGHPEYGHTPGVETTTGPLAQGLANAVGMAIAEARLAAEFGDDLVDHRTYVVVGDGCLMEGLAHEAMSLAGHLRLHKMIVLFDDNRITIDGPTALSHSDDTLAWVRALGWQTLTCSGHDLAAIDAAISTAKQADRPTLIAFRTTIGFGAPHLAGQAAVHGAPLGPEETAATLKGLGWEHPPFYVPEVLLATLRECTAPNAAAAQEWQERLAKNPQRAAFERRLNPITPTAETIAAVQRLATEWHAQPVAYASRQASHKVLEVVLPHAPEMLGGSADLTPSNNTRITEQGAFTAINRSGHYIHYGIREHAMAAIMNGVALHGGIRPYGGTFLVFSDYARPALRLAAMMGAPVIHVMTHDSIGLGEDGPTHQPIEHLLSLRAIPGLHVWRPADAIETAECWQQALLTTNAPSLLALSRQNLPSLRHMLPLAENLCARGGYVLFEPPAPRHVTLIASGSEVNLAVQAAQTLADEGIAAAVVSMPCWSFFDAQPADYRWATLRPDLAQVTIEAGTTRGWGDYTGPYHRCIGIDQFGASAPAAALYQHFNLTVDHIVTSARDLVQHVRTIHPIA